MGEIKPAFCRPFDPEILTIVMDTHNGPATKLFAAGVSGSRKQNQTNLNVLGEAMSSNAIVAVGRNTLHCELTPQEAVRVVSKRKLPVSEALNNMTFKK